MIISHSHRFIFIHIYKVAGTSIKDVLSSYDSHHLGEAPFYNRFVNKFVRKQHLLSRDFPSHIKARELKEMIPANIYQRYFKFVFVRNPFDWQVSLYHYMLENRDHWQYSTIKSMSFEEYINWRVSEDLYYQSDFILDNSGRVIVDYIGKLESIQDDFKKIREIMNLENLSIPHKNVSNHKKYQEYYNENTKKLILKNFEKDFDLLGYSRELTSV